MRAPGFAGAWYSTFGRLVATQEGNEARGTYEHEGGVIAGTVHGGVFSGTWRQGERSGPCELRLDEDGNGFRGHWSEPGAGHGEWTGVRLDLLPQEEGGFPGSWNSLHDGPLLSGPMVGEVGETDAHVWVQARDTSPLTLTIKKLDGSTIQVTAEPAWSEWLCVVFHVDGLDPGRDYEYSIESRYGVTARRRLRTAPPSSARRLRIAFGSCFWDYADPHLGIFDAIAREQPDVFLMVGDNCYYDLPDWQSAHTMMLGQLRNRNSPALRRLVGGVSTLAIWDDHDFGPNDSDSRFEGRELSRGVFERVWAQREYGSVDTPGIFSSVRAGPVEIILLDGRSHRIEERTILGDAQLSWLERRLAASDAPVKLVVSGSQVWPEVCAGRGWECWQRDAPADLERLLMFIEEHDVRGVVFVSGDVHLGYLIHRRGRPLPGSRIGPELWELTSSPLANDPWKETVMGQDDYDRTLVAELAAHNYGVVDVDLDRPGDEIRLTLADARGRVLVTQAVALRDLAVRERAALSAVVEIDGDMHFFAGPSEIRFDTRAGRIAPGYPRPIEEGWPGVTASRLGAVVVWDNGRAYFFEGNGYLAFEAATRLPLGGYPKYIGRWWKGLWPDGVDAGAVWNDGKAYFFKGPRCIRYDLAADRVDPGYPRRIEDDFPGVWPDGIDAVAASCDGKAYFFRGSAYIQVDLATHRADEGYPRPIEERWPGLLGG